MQPSLSSTAGEAGSPAEREAAMRNGWQRTGILAVHVDDKRLAWPERELLRQIGDRLYGPRPQGR